MAKRHEVLHRLAHPGGVQATVDSPVEAGGDGAVGHVGQPAMKRSSWSTSAGYGSTLPLAVRTTM